jgi:hypothetical protein
MRSLFCFVVTVGAVAACGDSPAASQRRSVATLAIVAQPAGSLAVTTNVGAFSVRATDSSGAPVPGAFVSFILARGSGRVTPLADTTDAAGIAETTVILGTAPGPHTARAATPDLPPVESGVVTGIAGATARVTLNTNLAALSATQDSVVVGAAAADAFGNGKSVAITWVSQNPASVAVTSGMPGTNATLRVQARPSETWVVALAGTAKDSVLVRAFDASSSPCAFLTAPTPLAIGAALPFEASGNACLSTASGAEYLVIAHYATTVNSVSATVNLLGTGITSPAAAYPMLAPAAGEPVEVAFERNLRERERVSTPSYVEGARVWQRNLRASIRASLKEGDQATINTNASDFCANPSGTEVRVAAITQHAIVLADMANPAGGYTDAEYRAFGTTFDTLVHPVDTAAFGVPTDIDGNGRVVILFTRAVNALTPRGSQGAVLGFFFSRDLLPQSGPSGSCPGSNVGEMFYVLVPDPTGLVSDARTKGFVDTTAVSTIAHEYQHLINTSRRIYVNDAPDSNEERWLNEGLSHIAEELVFYRASKLSPRQNIDSAAIKTSGQLPTLLLYQQGNLRRYQQYLRAPEANAPMAENDQLATRGAAWAFLRYAADRSRASDGDFWKRLVNSRLTGVRNLEAVLSGSGFTTSQLLEEWSRAVVTDDIVPGSTAQHPSWSFVTVMPHAGFAFPLAPSLLVNSTALSVSVRGSSSFYGRIAVPGGAQALVQATGPGGGTIPRGMRLTIVRIK